MSRPVPEALPSFSVKPPELVAPLPPRAVLGEYVVARLLGQGGFGSTYLAIDEHLKKPVAIKELTPVGVVHRRADGRVKPNGLLHAAAFAAMTESFLTEARLLAQFRHQHIASVLRFFEANDTAYMVMTYEEGVTLRAWTRLAGGTISEDELEAILLPICSGLSTLHSKGLIHRDVKPDNIIVRPDGSPCLIDFGAAVRFVRLSAADYIDVIATPHYAPPEQFDPAGNQGPWTDIYALGATLYELTTGLLPPTAQDRLASDQLSAASHIASGRYSSRLLSLVDQCLAVDAKARPASVEDLLVALRPEDDQVFARVLRGISLKMIDHFLNWATPNEHLLADELALFVTVFPILDLSWRLGEGLPSRGTFTHLLHLTASPPSTLDLVFERMNQCGFSSNRRNPTSSAALGRLDQYAASYLLDRQGEQWNYQLTRSQLIKQCLVSPTESDRAGFSSLMEDIIDRARGRVKRDFRKAFDRVAWELDTSGKWTKHIRPSPSEQEGGDGREPR